MKFKIFSEVKRNNLPAVYESVKPTWKFNRTALPGRPSLTA